MAFEPNVAPFITGNMAAPQVFDPHLNPASIIRTADNWRIRLNWDTSGLFIPLVNVWSVHPSGEPWRIMEHQRLSGIARPGTGIHGRDCQ